MKSSAIALFFSVVLIAGCDDHAHDDDHGHGHSHGEESHAPHGGHDDHDDHGGEDTTIAITHFTDETELFVEFPAFVVGQESPFAAHLTSMQDFQPVDHGRVTVTLSGGGQPDEVFSINRPGAPGIFRPVAVPLHPVTRQVSLRLQGDFMFDTTHHLGSYPVYPTQAAALANMPHEDEPHDIIAYLKETQWKVDFAITQARKSELRASIPATGTLRPRADGEAYINAASTGHLQGKSGFPHTGMKVKQGQRLATIVPRMGSGGDLATLKAARDKARSEHELAKHERERLEKLWQEKAIAQHRLHEAESAESVAKAELNAAQRRYKQSTGQQQSNAGIPVLAPIDGVLAQSNAAPGQYVDEGEMLFHIVNLDRLWLEARVAEVDLGQIQQATAAWFTLEGFADSFDTASLGGRMVALGGIVDPVSRTTPLIFEFDNPSMRLRAGMFANTRVFTGQAEQGVVIPASAVFDDGGQEVVYVQVAGESYQRRIVQLGVREGSQVIIRSGIESGEYVVSRGAYQVRLASASPAEAGHGHAH